MGKAKDAAVTGPPVPQKTAKTEKIKPFQKGTHFVKYYLTFYNILSAIGWTYILILILIHVFNLDGSASSTPLTTATASSILSRFLPKFLLPSTKPPLSVSRVEVLLPTWFLPIYRRSSSTYTRVGTSTAIVQSFAVLEVVHVLLKWVRSPLQTTVMQVASRLFIVWGVVEQFSNARTNPLFTSMVFAWSLTEVIRYSFYASALLEYDSPILTLLRYTTFYVLYPLGAGSEAFLNYSTLPRSNPLSRSWITGTWNAYDYLRGILFVLWWPGLFVMYTHMLKQRRKVFGGQRLGIKKTN